MRALCRFAVRGLGASARHMVRLEAREQTVCVLSLHYGSVAGELPARCLCARCAGLPCAPWGERARRESLPGPVTGFPHSARAHIAHACRALPKPSACANCAPRGPIHAALRGA